MTRFTMRATAALTLCSLAAASRAAVVTIDDFENYSGNANGYSLGTSASSTPYKLNGDVGAGLVTTKTNNMDGNVSASLTLAITTTGSKYEQVSRNYTTSTPIDFTGATHVSVVTRSLASTPIASLQLYITDGSGIYTTKTSALQLETATPTADTFLISGLTSVGTSESVATVLSKVSAIGFRITSGSSADNETLLFDDFTITVPEPSSIAFGVLALAGTLLSRHKKK